MPRYNAGEIEKIRGACRLTARCLQFLGSWIQPGRTSRFLDGKALSFIRKEGGRPAFLHYQAPDKPPFPGAICASVNDVVIHGVPDDRPLEEGDILSVDVGVFWNGFFGDAAWTFPVGKIGERQAALCRAGQEALLAGIARVRPGRRLAEVSRAVQRVTERAGFSVIRDFVGHGVGRALHEEPAVPNYVSWSARLPLRGPFLRTGMVLAIEPMVAMGKWPVKTAPSQWPVRTADGSPAVHFEHTVAVTGDGVEILTLPG